MKKSKTTIVIVGHVDHGKSTLIGRILYDTNSVSRDKLIELENASKNTDNKLEFAYLLDHLQEEREQGITIDTTQIFFETEIKEFQIIDAPGHVELVKNMITGASQASFGILIVDVTEGVMQQTIRHSYILSLLGIKNVVVVINKMDLVGYLQNSYLKVKNEIKNLLSQLHLYTEYYVPISALLGDNVYKESGNMKWYTGKNLVEILESLDIQEVENNDPFIMSVQDVYKVSNKRIIVGRVESGVLRADDTIKVIQTGQETQVKSIEKFLEKSDMATSGESIGIITKDSILIDRGYVLCNEKARIQYDNFIDANIIWLEQRKIQVNDRLVMRCGTQEITCIIEKVYYKINTGQLMEVNEDNQEINYLDASKVRIQTKYKFATTKFNYCKNVGRFVLLRDSNICASGIIL